MKYLYASENITLDEANEQLSKTTVGFFQNDKGKYMWFSLMCDGPCFDTLKEAYDDAVDYLNNNGY